MGQKEGLLAILQGGEALTQAELAQRLYGEPGHTTGIYLALMALRESGAVLRLEERPARYALAGGAFPPKKEERALRSRDVRGDVISNESLEETEQIVRSSPGYGPELKLLEGCLRRFPDNRDVELVAMKVGLIDLTNSTHLAQHKRLIDLDELSRIIVALPDLDARLAAGDPEVVNQLARSNGSINLFSFASKYCCYHNQMVYGRDDYSILDTVVRKALPLYFPDITAGRLLAWQKGLQYQAYNDYITGKLDQLGITIPGRKRKFDHYVWYKNR